MKYKYLCLDGYKGWMEAASPEACVDKMNKMGLLAGEIQEQTETGFVRVWKAPEAFVGPIDPPTAQPAEVPKHVAEQALAISQGRQSIDLKVWEDKTPATTPISMRDLASISKPHRRQDFYMGQYDKIRGFIDKALDEDGRVLHMSVNSDIKGGLIVAIVIEHNDKGESNA